MIDFTIANLIVLGVLLLGRLVVLFFEIRSILRGGKK